MIIPDPTLMYATVAFAALINEAMQKYKADGPIHENNGNAHTTEELEPLYQGLTLGELKNHLKANSKTSSPIRTAQYDGSNHCDRIYIGTQNTDEEPKERTGTRTTSHGSTPQERSTRSSDRKQLVQEIELSDMRSRQPVRRDSRDAHAVEELEPLQRGLTLGDFEKSRRAANREQQEDTFSSIKSRMFESAKTFMQKVRSPVGNEQNNTNSRGGRIYLGTQNSDEAELGDREFDSQPRSYVCLQNTDSIESRNRKGQKTSPPPLTYQFSARGFVSQTEAAKSKDVRSDKQCLDHDDVESEGLNTHLIDTRVTTGISNSKKCKNRNAY
ncbi:hypothetical protein R4I06_03315 [Anaplasma bovis]